MSLKGRSLLGFLSVPILAAAGFTMFAARVGSATAAFDYLLAREFSISAAQFSPIDASIERVTFALTNLSGDRWVVKSANCSCTCVQDDVMPGSLIAPWTPTEFSFDVDRTARGADSAACRIFLDTTDGLISVELALSPLP
jgi:hypothetical protein